MLGGDFPRLWNQPVRPMRTMRHCIRKKKENRRWDRGWEGGVPRYIAPRVMEQQGYQTLMKHAVLGKSIPKRPNSWDNEQTPVLERGSTISSELCRVELGEAGEGVGLAPTSSSPCSHPQSTWSCWRCSDWGTWVLHAMQLLFSYIVVNEVSDFS